MTCLTCGRKLDDDTGGFVKPCIFCALEKRIEALEKDRNNFFNDKSEVTIGERKEQKEELFPCMDCGKTRTKAEGGTVFAVCETCWDKHYAKPKKEEKAENEIPLEILMKEFLPYSAYYVIPDLAKAFRELAVRKAKDEIVSLKDLEHYKKYDFENKFQAFINGICDVEEKIIEVLSEM